MNTKFSAIGSWLAAKRPAHEQLDSCAVVGFVCRLGDVKVETKHGTGTQVIDDTMPLERYTE
jgi:hypothetical protein